MFDYEHISSDQVEEWSQGAAVGAEPSLEMTQKGLQGLREASD